MAKMKLWLCRGASYKGSYTANMVGDIHTMKDWLQILFPHKPIEQTLDFFDGYSESEIAKYIFENTGKRLEKIKLR